MEAKAKSPLDIKGVDAKGLSQNDILSAIKEGRKKYRK